MVIRTASTSWRVRAVRFLEWERMTSDDGEALSEEVAARADAVANEAVEAEGVPLTAALESGNVIDAEQAFYRVFRRIYLEGLRDGRNAQ